MTVAVQVDPRLHALLGALGLLDGDGQLQPSWFEHPLDAIRQCLNNDSQRAALFQLLDQALPPESGPFVPTGAAWHPLLEANGYGNVYLTVESGVIGVAATVGTMWTDLPSVRLVLRMPLITTGDGDPRATVGPLDLLLVADLDPNGSPASIGLRARVDFAGAVQIAVRLEDGTTTPRAIAEFDPTTMDASTIAAIQLLVRSVLAHETSADPRVLRLVTHLPGVVGLGDALLTPLPITEPSTIRAWFAGIVASPPALRAWFTHVAGALGAADLESDTPDVSGLGVVDDPLRATMLVLENFGLQLQVAAGGPSETALHLGLGVAAQAGPVMVAARVTVAAIPLDGVGPATVLPAASAHLSVAVSGGHVEGGVAWDGVHIAPLLRLVGVQIAGTSYNVDLTDANAIVAAAVDTVVAELGRALGVGDNGQRALALVGLAAPVGDPDSPYRLGAEALSGNLLRAIAEVHRGRLGDPDHPWSSMLADIAGLLGQSTAVSGDGSRAVPWCVRLAGDDTFALELAAWDDRQQSTPDGVHLLRLGLRASAGPTVPVTAGPSDERVSWRLSWSTELLSFDFVPQTATAIRFVGAQHLGLSFTDLPPLELPAGLSISAGGVGAALRWLPGTPAEVAVTVPGLFVRAGTDEVGPLDLTLPGRPDLSRADLGIGVSAAEAVDLVRLLLSRAWSLWGDDMTAHTVAGLLGLHDDLASLPPGWPSLFDGAREPAQVLADPIAAWGDYARRVLTGAAADGEPFARTALAWFAALVAGKLPAGPGERPVADVTGLGSHEQPWEMAVPGLDAQLLVWLEPGPVSRPDPRIRAATDGLGLLTALRTAGVAGDLLRGRDLVTTGLALDTLAAWLGQGDGLVPYASATAAPTPLWTVGAPLTASHRAAPADPVAIAQVKTQLTTWAGPPVLLLTTATATTWSAMIAGIEPGHDPDARIDLRDRPTADLSQVTAVASCYPVELDDADLNGLLAQINHAAARVRTLTGAPRVALVGHGPAGVAARVAAARQPAGFRGVITIGAPHAGSELPPLTRPELAEAARLADLLGGGEPVAMLRAILDGGPPRDGVLPPAGAYSTVAFAGMPDGLVDTVPGLAIGSRLPGDLVQIMAGACAAWPHPPTGPVTHVAVGASVRLATPPTAAGAVDLDARLRVDLLRIPIGSAPAPARSPRRLSVSFALGRGSEWLVGDPGDRVDAGNRAVVRARWAELVVVVDQNTAGALTVIPTLKVHQAGPRGTSAEVLGLDDIVAALATRPAAVGLPAGLNGPAADLVRSCLYALDLTNAAGHLVTSAVTTLAAGPAAWLGPRLPALLAVLAPAVGASAHHGGWRLPLPGGTQELRLTPAPWTLRLSTVDGAGSSGGGLFAGLTVDAALVLPGFETSAAASLAIGPLRLIWDGALELAMPPWLAPVRLAPAGDPGLVAAALLQALPRGLLSAALGMFLQPVLGGAARALPLDQVLLDPATFLRQALGDGQSLRAAKVNALLDAISTALGQPRTGGLDLPGGLRLRATEPFTLHLDGTVPIGDSTLELGLGLALAADLTPSPSGTVAIAAVLPGNWLGLRVTAGASAAGVTLSVQPNNAAVIEILPRFDGLGALSAGAGALLPHLLQTLVDELSPPGPVASATLDLAAALGIYGHDAQGFEKPERAAALARMLAPGWLRSVAADAPTLVGHIAALFGPPPLLAVPFGVITAVGNEVHWTIPVATGGPVPSTITAGLGWRPDGQPKLSLSAGAVDLGPVIVDSAMIGFDGQVVVDVAARLALPGVLAPLAPGFEIGVTAGRFTAEIAPLGLSARDEFVITLAPTPAVTFTPQAAVDMVVQWGLPLALEILVAALGDAGGSTPLLERPFWTDGPTARTILAGAGLFPLTGALTLTQPLPDPLAAVLGAVRAAATGVSIQVTDTLTLSIVDDAPTGRTGIRLVGRQNIETDDVTVSVRFGDASWLDDPAAGLTLWLLEPEPTGPIPVRLTAALSVVGLGVVLEGDPLVDGSLVVGAAGGLIFFDATFLDAQRAPTLRLDHLGAGLGVERTFVNISSDDGDSFLAKILPSELKAPFDLAVLYRDGHLSIAGTSPLSTGHIEIVIPLDLDLTVIQITELLIGMRIGNGTLALEAALSGGADLGPLVAAIQRVGLIATFGDGGVGMRLRPPDKVGLAIDTSTLRLGGFLLVDAEHGRYIGGIEIAVLGKFELSAIGIITTKLPDGSPGFSLLFIISMTLPVPIAMGYGFFFAGAGGLLGLNRGVDLDALRSGLRTGTAESILFPKDIVRRADAIVRDLEAVFPIAPGQFVIGPMVMITWSTPALITIKLGLILELGTPIRIAILGLLHAALPDPKDAVLDLKVAFLGSIDIPAALLSFDAAIYDSGIGIGDFKLSLEGDIAVRVSWGAQPDFVTSVGGFHPAYHPGAHLKLPAMKRLTISLLRDNPRLSLRTYFALTANSLQFGARLEFYFGVGGFEIEGEFGFDVLLQISPFLFDAAIQARLVVRAGDVVLMGLSLDFSLRGPTPWIARGTASLSILFFTVEVAFEKRFGQELESTIPDVAVLPAIVAELTRPENWAGHLGIGVTSLVSLSPIAPAEGVVVIDAAGDLTITQRLLPLGTELTRFGNSRPSDVSRVEIASVSIGGTADVVATTEMFSPGAFTALSDDDKLRSAAFVERPGGVRATAGAVLRTDYALARPAHYDLIVCSSPVAGAPPVEHRTRGHHQDRQQFEQLARGGATGRSTASRDRRWQAERGSTLDFGPTTDRYAVTRPDDLRPLTDTGAPATAQPGPDGRLGYPDGILLGRVDADARMRALRADGIECQVLAESQVVLI